MCGIAGYIGPCDIDDRRAWECLDLMRHRGPDDSGIYRHEHPSGTKALILHTRLSIIDLNERAAQPMRHDSSMLAFNGEVYNYREIRDRLEAEGEDLTTTSDTEVLLRKLCREGIDALDDMEGMWAFAFYDEQSGELTLGRDRFGEKPLYLYRDSGGLYFGSEIKFLSCLAATRFTPNDERLRRFLVDGYRFLYRGGASLYREITEVASGTCLTRKPTGDSTVTKYWRPSFEQDPDMTFEEAVAGARQRLIRAVELRLRSDVPLAFCMSGGIDSNGLISIAKRVLGYDVHGFTAAGEDARYAEMHLVDQAVQAQGLKHTRVPIEATDFLSRLRDLVRAHDAPVYTISYYVHWLVMRQIAANGYKVAISGTGADELFTGYYDHYSMYLRSVHGDESDFDEALENWRSHVGPVIRNPRLQDPFCFIKNPEQRSHFSPDRKLLESMVGGSPLGTVDEDRYTGDLLRDRMLNELFTEVVPVILHEDDHNAMLCSVENRSPYLDRELFEFCQSIPSRLLMRNGYNKAVLREALRGIVPDAILDERRKVGFNAPILGLLDMDDPGTKSEIEENSMIHSLVNGEYMNRLLDAGSLTNSQSKFLFSLICSAFFLEME